MPLVRRGGGSFAGYGLGNVPPSSTVVNNSDDSNQQNLISEGIAYAKTIYENWVAGGTRDAIRENRAKTFMGLAIAGSVLAAQVCLAGPDNVASNEDPYWVAAQKGIQAARPDVWTAAVTAGAYWPVGAQFDAIPLRTSIGQQLAGAGITINAPALNQPFTTTFVPVVATTKAGTQIPTNVPQNPPAPGQTPPLVPPGTPPPVPGTPPPVASTAGFTSPILLLALIGAAAYVMLAPKRRR